MDSTRPKGNIKTVLDLAERDGQDDFFTPLTAELSWFHRNPVRTIPFTPTIQTFPYRGPAAFGSTIVVDIKSQEVGDLLHFIGVQIQLGSWIKSTNLFSFFSGEYKFTNRDEAWTWANAIGTILVDQAYLQIGDTVIETVDSVGAAIFFSLFPNINEQIGTGTDAFGAYAQKSDINPDRPFSVEDGKILCVLPFWFSRSRYTESLPLVSCNEGSIKFYITFRPFDQVVRQCRGFRDSCTSVPLGLTIPVAVQPNVYNSLQSARLNTDSYYNTGDQTYTVPILSPAFMRQTIPLQDPVSTLKIGLSVTDYANVAYLELIIESEFVMNLSTITFYSQQETFKTFTYTLPSGGIIATKTASIVFNDLRITSTAPLTLTFSKVEVLNAGVSTITTEVLPPAFQNIEIMTYSSLVDGDYRDKIMRQPYEMLYRNAQAFHFDEPLKYATIKPNSTVDNVTVNLSLECNGPCEEIIWVIRRKGVAVNNDWVNFGPQLEMQEMADRYALPLLEGASIWINGVPFIEQTGEWFRNHIAEKHKGGIVAYNRYVYGYVFARTPGKHQPTGTVNMSRASSVQLRLTVRAPQPVTLPGGFAADLANSWEVHAYCLTLNWLRFQNGIANRMFSA
jgi:hypothetical protein